jgi:hypothetical protein
MARRGRKRKDAKRHPCGQIKREDATPREPDAGPTPEMAKHKKASGGGELVPLSYLLVRSLITPEQHDAMHDYARLKSAAWGKPFPKAGALREMVGGEAPVPMTSDDLARARQRYESALEALRSAGALAVQVVDFVAYSQSGHQLNERYMQALLAGATALAGRFERKRAA